MVVNFCQKLMLIQVTRNLVGKDLEKIKFNLRYDGYFANSLIFLIINEI